MLLQFTHKLLVKLSPGTCLLSTRLSDRLGQARDAREACAGLLGESPSQSRANGIWNGGQTLVEIRNGLVDVSTRIVRASENVLTCQHPVQHATQRVLIRFSAWISQFNDLWRHVVMATNPYRHSGVAIQQACDTEIGQQGIFPSRRASQEDVLGLNVAVNEALIMKKVQSIGDLLEDAHAPFKLDRAALKYGTEIRPVDEFHYEVQPALINSRVVQLDDVLMIDTGHHLNLTMKASTRIRVVLEMRSQQLESHLAMKLLIDGSIYNAHAAGADATG